jgi:hypothetical protein
MSHNNFNPTARAARIFQKSTAIEFEEIKIPVPDSSFVNQFKSATGVHSGRSNQYIVDVLPSFVSLNMFCIYHANLYISSLNPREHAKVSTATLTMYFMTLIYAHFLVSDCYIRPQASPHADFFFDHNYATDFLYFLLNLPVPEFLVPVIKSFSATSTARRNNIIYCPSAAGYMHNTHFGRIYPLNMYTNIHDIAATSNSRSDPSLVNHELLTNTLYSVQTSKNMFFTVDTGMLIASNIPGENPNTFTYLNNKVNQVFMSLFNPVIIRALQQKQSFAPINLTSPKFSSVNHNPYLMMFSLSPRNASELKTVLSSVAATFKGIIKCPGDLASLYTNLSGVSILNHSYSAFALPTFHATHIPYNDAVKTKYTPLESDDFAKKIKFLQRPDQKTLADKTSTRTELKYPTNTPADKKIANFDPKLYMIVDEPFPEDETKFDPLNDNFLQYDEDVHLYPRMRYFNPYEESSVDAWLSSVTGLIIEAHSLTSSIVPHPDIDLLLGAENSYFAQSAIPFKQTVLSTSFSLGNTAHVYTPQIEARHANSQPAVSLLTYVSTLIIPQATRTYVHSGINAIAHGISLRTSATMPEFFRTFFGLRIHDNPSSKHDADIHEPASSNPHQLYVFSPYTYVSRSFDYSWSSSSEDTAMSNIFFLTNFRTIFGTDVTLQEISHPLDAMPIS